MADKEFNFTLLKLSSSRIRVCHSQGQGHGNGWTCSLRRGTISSQARLPSDSSISESARSARAQDGNASFEYRLPGFTTSRHFTTVRCCRRTWYWILSSTSFHFGWPDLLDIFGPEFIRAFERFTARSRAFLRSRRQPRTFVVPVNEISFFSWAGGDRATSILFPATADTS